MSTVAELQAQLKEARTEINNLRKKLSGLHHTHQKDINHIRTTLKTWKCAGCQEKPQNLHPIGVISTDFPRIRGTPRQPSVTKQNTAKITLNKRAFTNPEHSLDGLQSYSHMWVIFLFHENEEHPKAKVAPPRLNGVRTGVFSTRSPYRPCPIGLSLVKIQKIINDTIFFYGVDMIDQTPVLDIKPYIPQYDKPEEEVVVPDWIQQANEERPLKVVYLENALEQLRQFGSEETVQLIQSVLHEDPRSVYLRKKGNNSAYVLKISEFTVECRFKDQEGLVEVCNISK
ncbi:tRNA (adenine(37)-N6)-methyltransferase [Anthonomus grandis grandis]|uniref:tRNA (adenine(37)-N6)-methyltransferase n=1 Tax=Anthonomus grandis grandis TaxID=2921223 RepID=UPI0021657AA8|nr:tRNA (adenine(37)-N6)-methyltransferase [Anthonomus grandis grandis]